MKILRLHGGIGRNRRNRVRDAIAGLGAAAETLRIEAGVEMVAGKSETVGGHPVLRIGERAGEIERSRTRCAIDARLEGIAAPAAKLLAQGSSRCRRPRAQSRRPCPAQCDSPCRPQRRPYARSGHGFPRPADRRWLVVAAIGSAPHAPALLERDRLVDRRAQHLGVGECDVFRQRLALGCERDRRTEMPPTPARPSTNGSSMMPRELVHQLKRGLLRAGRHFAGKRVSALARLPPVRSNKAKKFGGSVPPMLKKLLIAPATFCWFWLSPTSHPESGAQAQQHVGCSVAEGLRQICRHRPSPERRAAQPGICVQDRCTALRPDSWPGQTPPSTVPASVAVRLTLALDVTEG